MCCLAILYYIPSKLLKILVRDWSDFIGVRELIKEVKDGPLLTEDWLRKKARVEI